MSDIYHEKTVVKFGPRGAHVIVPKEWIGKVIYITLEKPKNDIYHQHQVIEPEKPFFEFDKTKDDRYISPIPERYISPTAKPLPEKPSIIALDEAEEIFLQQYEQATPVMKNVLLQRAQKQFGKARVAEIMKK